MGKDHPHPKHYHHERHHEHRKPPRYPYPPDLRRDTRFERISSERHSTPHRHDDRLTTTRSTTTTTRYVKMPTAPVRIASRHNAHDDPKRRYLDWTVKRDAHDEDRNLYSRKHPRDISEEEGIAAVLAGLCCIFCWPCCLCCIWSHLISSRIYSYTILKQAILLVFFFLRFHFLRHHLSFIFISSFESF